MFFQFSSGVTGLARYAEKSDVEFSFDSPRAITVRMSKGYPDGVKPNEAADAGGPSTAVVAPPEAKTAGERKAGGVLPVVDGKVKVGDPTTEFIDGVFDQLRAAMISTATLAGSCTITSP